jgi:hypothetical protein
MSSNTNVEATVNSLNDNQLDVAMKYIYLGMESGKSCGLHSSKTWAYIVYRRVLSFVVEMARACVQQSWIGLHRQSSGRKEEGPQISRVII